MNGNSLSVSMETYNELKKRIMELYYRPGEILLIQQLINDLGVSRTPVKEALIRLTADNFLENNNDKRFRVKEVSAQTITEVFETRMALEGMAVEKLAATINEGQLSQLKEIIEDTQNACKQGDTLEVLRLDKEFHRHMVEIHGNETLARVLVQLNERIQQIRLMCQTSRHIEEVAVEHRRIYDALCQRDRALAREKVNEHLRLVSEDMLEMLGRKRGPVYLGNIVSGR